jgi:hypothetical protein
MQRRKSYLAILAEWNCFTIIIAIFKEHQILAKAAAQYGLGPGNGFRRCLALISITTMWKE